MTLNLPDEVGRFRAWLVQHALRSEAEVKEQVNVNVFFSQMLDGYKLNIFGETPFERKRFFMARSVPVAHPPDYPNQRANVKYPWQAKFPEWESVTLFFDASIVLTRISEHLRKSGKNINISKKDLKAQLEPHTYFRSKSGKHDIKQRMAGHLVSVWALELDRMDNGLGRRPVPDEEVWEAWGEACLNAEETLKKNGEMGTLAADLAAQEWVDPRRGDLYRITDDLKEKPGATPEEEKKPWRRDREE